MRRRSAMRRMIRTMLALVLTTCLPARSDAQPATTAQESPVTPAPRWEVSLEGRVGFPTGNIRVSETVTHGTRLRLSDLGLDVSEAVEAGVGGRWPPPEGGQPPHGRRDGLYVAEPRRRRARGDLRPHAEARRRGRIPVHLLSSAREEPRGQQRLRADRPRAPGAADAPLLRRATASAAAAP